MHVCVRLPYIKHQLSSGLTGMPNFQYPAVHAARLGVSKRHKGHFTKDNRGGMSPVSLVTILKSPG